MKRRIKLAVYILFFIGIIILSAVLQTVPSDDYRITFIDVGQGDSTVIKSKKACVLIDAGADKDARKIRVILDRLKVKTIDLAVLSHLDSDHISGMRDIIENYKVKRIVTGKIGERYFPDSPSLNELDYAVDLNNVDYDCVKAGEKLSVGDIDIDVISPEFEYGKSNEDSAVLKIICGGKKLLFTGDISSKVEKDIMRKNDVKADILKVSHHGSYTATSKKFLQAVNPSFAVVSVSKYNNYNLPNLKVMRRLYGYGCKVLRTDEMGNVTIKLNDGETSFESEK